LFDYFTRSAVDQGPKPSKLPADVMITYVCDEHIPLFLFLYSPPPFVPEEPQPSSSSLKSSNKQQQFTAPIFQKMCKQNNK
jgi:hypothetical protein